ncbi:MAG: FKBP-type peptidyl-prolyl cis-trans isomerase N-terminal domain-containing protein [Bacteroidetes bacterium]|nr:FKBP-type peptidyl-prolyl cis-trans isomerase N-terminal domain-containing protein [Bacteroidota bacterium]
MRKYSYLAIASALIFASCGRTVNPNKAPKTSLDSFSYSVGFQIGKSMKEQGIEKLDYSSFIKGMEEATKKDSGYTINPEKMNGIQRDFMTKARDKKKKEYQDASKKWMSENAKKEGVSLLPSKGQFKLIKAGKGATPGAYDTVEYHLVVKNHKGKELYDSKKGPQVPKRVISNMGLPAVEESFQKVTEGAVFEVYVQNDAMEQMGGDQPLEDLYGISIYTFELIRVIPGKAPAPEKAPEMPIK